MEEVDRITQEQCEKELNWTEFTPAIVAQLAEQRTYLTELYKPDNNLIKE